MPSASDVALVAGLKPTDKVLLLGGKQGFTALKKGVKSVTVVTKKADVDSLVGEGSKYDKVFLLAGGFPSLLPASVKLLNTHGTLLFVNEDALIRDTFKSTIARNFSDTTTFESDSSIGALVGCSPKGYNRWETR